MKLDQTLLKSGSKWALLSAFAVFASLMQPAFATDWYVDAVNGNDAYDGTSAATAKQTIQSAIDLTGSGDTVYVAPGRYNSGSMTCAFNSTVARVVVTNKINLVATGRKDETFIDGGAEMRCIYVYRDGNTYKKADGSVFRGFTICNGSVTGSSTQGAGAYIPECYLIDCVVSNNVNQSYRGGGSYSGTAIRCFYTRNSSGDHGMAASGTKFLNSVIAFHTIGKRMFYAAGVAVNCTVVANTLNTWSYDGTSGKCYLYNTIFAGNSSNTFYDPERTIASNCVLVAGNSWSSEHCGNISTEYPDFCFAAPCLDDWRPKEDFNIASHGDAELLKKISLPAELENERYIDYNGKPIPQTGAITCGAVQDICTDSRALLKLQTGLEVEGYGITPSISTAPAAAVRYMWVGNPGAFKMRKAGADLKDVMWYTLNTNGAFKSYLIPDTNNWVVVTSLSSLTNEVAAVAPAKTFYVDAETGDDSYSGTDLGTAEHPFSTIQAAIDASPNGSGNTLDKVKNTMILVRKGEYRTGGSSSARVSVLNKVNNAWTYKRFRIVSEEGPKKTFIIGASGEGTDGCGTGAQSCCYSGVPTLVQGFTLTGGHGSTASVYNSNARSNAFLADCIVTNHCSSGATIYRATVIRCRIAGNKLTAANAADIADSTMTMSEVVQSPESAAGSYAMHGNSYTYFSVVKGALHQQAHLYASILGGGQTIGKSDGYARYCFAHGDPLVAYNNSATAVQNCQNGKSRCLSYANNDFRLRSDSPAIGLVTFDPDTYYVALTLDLDGNLPPLDTLEGWTAGPRQRASVEWHARGATFVIR